MIIASDLEGTLTTGSTWKAIGRYLNNNGKQSAYRVFLALHLPGLPLSKLGIVDELAYRNWWMKDLAGFLKGSSAKELQSLAEWIVEDELWPNRRQDVIAELEQHSRNGDQVILSSGAWQPVLEAFAQRIGSSLVTLGTALEMVSGTATGRLAAPVNTGKTKAATLQQYLRDKHLDAAYGDTQADVPMMELSKNPVAVYPDTKLQAIAVSRGWRILTA